MRTMTRGSKILRLPDTGQALLHSPQVKQAAERVEATDFPKNEPLGRTPLGETT
jgi:hypothetical protein